MLWQVKAFLESDSSVFGFVSPYTNKIEMQINTTKVVNKSLTL